MCDERCECEHLTVTTYEACDEGTRYELRMRHEGRAMAWGVCFDCGEAVYVGLPDGEDWADEYDPPRYGGVFG